MPCLSNTETLLASWTFHLFSPFKNNHFPHTCFTRYVTLNFVTLNCLEQDRNTQIFIVLFIFLLLLLLFLIMQLLNDLAMYLTCQNFCKYFFLSSQPFLELKKNFCSYHNWFKYNNSICLML